MFKLFMFSVILFYALIRINKSENHKINEELVPIKFIIEYFHLKKVSMIIYFLCPSNGYEIVYSVNKSGKIVKST